MAPRDNLEQYEATEAQDLTRLLRALRPPERTVQVPPPVDLTIRAEIWKVPVQRQVITLLSLARRDLIQVIRQALTDNPLLEEVARAEDEHTPASGEHAQGLTASADDLTDGEELYHSIWQECVPDGWDASGLPAQASAVSGASEHSNGSPEALVPDVIVRKVGQDYQVFLNDEGMPRLRLSATYRRLVREGQWGEPEAMQHLDDKLSAAVWLLRSLEHRHQTLLKVTTGLVTRQRDCLDHGLAHVKPLALMEVAEALGLHASTMHLVLTNKYLATAHGTIALTSFFQSGIGSSGGETMSSLTVKDRIKTLVAAEDPATPLTDQQLAEVLAAEHITIARRTVTTYRRELQLPPAHRRQQGSSTAGASRLSLDEEQRVRQILENPANLPLRQAWLHSRQSVPDPVEELRQASRDLQAEPPPQRDREETSGIPPESEETRRRRDDEAAASPHQWVEKISGEVRAARRDLQTALAHRQLRPAVLLALRAFAQAAQAGATTPPPADAVTFPFVELGPNLLVPLDARAPRQGDLLIGKSPRMREVTRLLEQARETTATVLITGEPGTGKDLIARILHDQGPRAQGPFITVNCATILETRLEAELFGEEHGIVTGATQRTPGYLELAAGGTLFLDEIDALSLALQAKFLRVLREQRFTHVGGTETLTTDARIVAATHHDLQRLMTEGRFRSDLFYRLNVYPIALPPLRERPEDLRALTLHSLKPASHEGHTEVPGMSEEAIEWLERYSWLGNVREPEEVIAGAVARGQGPTVSVQDLPQALREQSRAPGSNGDAFRLPPGGIDMRELEKDLIRQALEQAHQNKSQAAKLLRLSRTQLRARMRLYGLE
jgi:two-component system response regulator AtoC